ncbi:MAG TPA: IS110 family transposase [Candidatus Faecenecus gallistercoris]|uniref:IS110 family transposase n=1 Tax=Candidatus Faecenecus gallistercoris TaxID=2840793 RepID=A0A9D0YYG3_9FIRM|nr:IS110 family transposase [Candidatus Faecenecus gallistercoris]
MYFVGIDVSKYKHDCFICSETGEVIEENLSFQNTNEGFTQLLNLLNSLNNNHEIRIGFEATGHYGMNLKLFLEKNNYSFMEFNPALVKQFIKGQTLRRTKTDKKDAFQITKYLMSVDYKPHPKQFYHKFSLKSLSRKRDKLVTQRSYYLNQITNILDLIFPEFKPLFDNEFSITSLYILSKYKTPDKIKNMKDFDSINRISRGKFSYAKFLKIKEIAKNTIGQSDDYLEFDLKNMLKLYDNINSIIKQYDDKIEAIIKELNPPTLSIKGIGPISCAAIISEFGDVARFKSADAMVAFAGIEPSVSESGTEQHDGKMVKHGSSHLRYHLLNAADYVFLHESIFTEFYYKKRNEGKTHRVALSHVAKKLVRIIYKLESENITFKSDIK